MSRKSGMNLEGYPNYIAPYNVEKLSRRHHPLGKMPVYPTNGEPQVWYEERLAEERYKNLADEWCRVHREELDNLIPPGMPIMGMLGSSMQRMMMAEFGKYRQLEKIAEDTVREYFNIDKTEVEFDIEILDPTKGEKPADSFNFKNGKEELEVDDPSFTPDFREEIIRRRLTNALIQGASLKGHYLFHMATPRLNELMPNVTQLYNSAMITNDLMYYYIDDVQCGQAAENESQAGAMEVDYSGEVPVIRCKAMCFTVLMHEMIKGVTEVLFAHGIPKDPVVAQKVIDTCDTVLNEFWDIRLGPKMWEKFYNLIDPQHYDHLKHIVVGVAKLDTEDFLAFLKNMFSGHIDAKNTILKIVGTKIHQIAEYAIEKNYDSDAEEGMPDIDWESLGL